MDTWSNRRQKPITKSQLPGWCFRIKLGGVGFMIDRKARAVSFSSLRTIHQAVAVCSFFADQVVCARLNSAF